jgi:hypothetical protein
VLEKDGEYRLDQLCEELRSEQRVKERNNLQTIKKSMLSGLVTSCIQTAFYNRSLKER